jgi:ferrous iron transport protein B
MSDVPSKGSTAYFKIPNKLMRGKHRPRVALVGLPRGGKSTIFQAAASTQVQCGLLAGSDFPYEECMVEVGLDQASLVDLPAIRSLHEDDPASQLVLKYLLWGDCWPAIARHEGAQPETAFHAPDVLIQVIDATALERHLELAQELSLLGRPLVLALNRLDEAREKGIYINVRALSEQLGVPVIPTVAHMGKGISALFAAAVEAVRNRACPVPQPPSPHLRDALQPLNEALAMAEVQQAFRVPRQFLLMQIACDNTYYVQEMACHFPEVLAELQHACQSAEARLPRPLPEEIHADRHHRAAVFYEQVTRLGNAADQQGWKRVLDRIFLHPRWGLIGCLSVFALVLFFVFEISSYLDGYTSKPLGDWVGTWEPTTTMGVIGRAIADGLVGLVGIVVPYMLPLVLLLVALEESGIMHRVAFVVDRGFHHIGLHGGVALPFLLGLGCNVPALSAAAATSTGRERIVASLLITFVPCSARSAIILALGGKYLGWAGVLGIFALTLITIAVSGKLLTRRYVEAGPGMIQEIPAYALPAWKPLLWKTWDRTNDILTIVTPLLVVGSVVLALLSHFGADAVINTLLLPVTNWWLGLPVALGVPILFGVLRKELSLLMIYQALGVQEITPTLDNVQIATFIVFLTFYVPCISTFAVMLKTLGRREAFFSLALSVAVALGIAGVCRLMLGSLAWVGLM